MSKWIRFKNCCAITGFGLTLFISLIIVLNQFESLVGLDSRYRVTMPALCLAFSFLTAAINIRLGLISCIFALPLLPNLTWQIQQYIGYGRILALHNSGLDLMAGLFLGGLVNQIVKNKKIALNELFPWQLGLLLIFLGASVTLAITRNLHQTASIFQLSTLLFNLSHLRSLGWHDDYRPIFDWVVFGSASSMIFVVVSALKSTPKRDDYIFVPLIFSLITAAAVGFRQSKYGMGLSHDLLNFRVDQFGYVALGFQNDLHAYAGQMLIGAIGLGGYLLYTKEPKNKLLVLLSLPICWMALFLSKSKSNFVLALICMIIIFIMWIFRHSRLIKPLVKTSLISILLIALSAIFFQDGWISILTSFANRLGLQDLAALNIKLSYRPEVYLTGFKFFTFAPILGLGQSEFYRQAANYALTNSHFLSIDQNGENAHNYFLQTLVETGLVGIALYTLVIFYPVYKIKNKRLLLPAGMALGAIFIGNLLAHSLLVRENLFIASGFIGLMYAWLNAEKNLETSPLSFDNRNSTKKVDYIKQHVNFLKHRNFITVCVIVLITISLREVYLSYRKEPFLEDVQCFKARSLDPNGWTSGLFKISIPEGAKGITLNIKAAQPYIEKRPLEATMSILHGNNSLIEQSQQLFDHKEPIRISINFKDNAIADDGDYRAELRLQRCFIPRNLKINTDDRRLGVQIESVTVNY